MKNKRREFIRNIGLGSAAMVTAPLITSARNNSRALKRDTVELGKDIKIELLTTGNNFIGIGKVSVDNTNLRNGNLPMCCEIRSPESTFITQLQIIEKAITPQRIFLKMNAQVHTSGIMDWMVHTVRNRESLYGWASEPKDDANTIVTLEIFPTERVINNHRYRGFSYQYSFSSSTFSIYKILDKSTWEIDGKAVGNTCWMRVGHVPSIVPIENIEQPYSTENYYPGIANPNPFQFLPLQTELQGFTFQSHEKGVLATWPTEVSHVRTLIEKPFHQNSIFHFHQHCNDLSGEFKTSPVEVLWLAQDKTNIVDRYNIYEELRNEIHGHLHKQSGIKQERISTYGQIEEWTEPDFDHYTDVILPLFIKKGISRIFLPSEFQNAMNEFGLSNMCCNIDYKFSATACPEKIKRFCDAALKEGILVDMWGNTAISTLTELCQWKEGKEKRIQFLPQQNSISEVLQSAKEPFVRNPSNAIEADHYAPRFAVLNFRDKDVINYWMKSWQIAFETGIHGIFLDSSFNMTSDKFHFIQNIEHNENYKADESDPNHWYRPEQQPPAAILTQYPAFIQLVKEMQQMGFSYCGEDLGVFGVHRHGPDIENILDCMPLWPECIINFNEAAVIKVGLDSMTIFFKGLAYRTMWSMVWDFKKNELNLGTENPLAFQLLEVFNKVNHLMHKREIAEHENAVKYSSADGNTNVWWVLKSFSISLDKKQIVWDILGNNRFKTKVIKANPLKVYVIINET